MVLGAHTQRQKSKCDIFPVDGELVVALTAIDPAHGSCWPKNLKEISSYSRFGADVDFER